MTRTLPSIAPLRSYLHTLRVAQAMATATTQTLRDVAHHRLTRRSIDERARAFAARVIDELDLDLHVIQDAPTPLDPQRAYVLVSNHQSHLDIPVLYAALPPLSIRMVGKRELFAIPLWGRALRAAEFISIDRSHPQAARDSIRQAAMLMNDGISVWIAPEGTRSRTGAIGPLKKGAFHLAKETQCPIIPIAIDGTRLVLPKGSVAMRSGVTVRVVIGAPIAAPTDEVSFRQAMQAVETHVWQHVTAAS